MTRHHIHACAIAAVLALSAAPAAARRTAVDQNPDGSQITATVGGYCDFNGDECGASSAVPLGYTVTLGSSAPVDSVYVSGNGLLSFGSVYAFANFYPADPDTYSTDHDPYTLIGANSQDSSKPLPTLADYGVNLVSPGQSDDLVDSTGNGGPIDAFLQGGRVSVLTGGTIHAEWYICFAPSAPDICPTRTLSSLDLTPTIGGFVGRFSGATGDDAGFVIDGVSTSITGNSFFLPAQISGLALSSAVPEPSSWALAIGGIGLAGGMMRRDRGRRVGLS